MPSIPGNQAIYDEFGGPKMGNLGAKNKMGKKADLTTARDCYQINLKLNNRMHGNCHNLQSEHEADFVNQNQFQEIIDNSEGVYEKTKD